MEEQLKSIFRTFRHRISESRAERAAGVGMHRTPPVGDLEAVFGDLGVTLSAGPWIPWFPCDRASSYSIFARCASHCG